MNVKKSLISGLIGGLVFIIVGTILHIPFMDIYKIYEQESAVILRESVLNPTLNTHILIYGLYLIYGIIIALFYSMLNHSIPGKKPFIKGLIYGLIVWTIMILMQHILIYITYKQPFVPLLIGTIIDMISIPVAGGVIAVVYEKLK